MTPEKNPNIVIIFADDLGYGDFGCFGAEKIPTPNVDGLAEQGICFTDAHASSAVCTPSRYGLLTGRYCWRTWLTDGVIDGFGKPVIDGKRLTLPAMLKTQGYDTCMVGKWHLGFRYTTKNGNDYHEEIGSDGKLSGPDRYTGFEIDYTKPFTNGPVDRGFDSFFGITGSLDMAPYCFIENDRTVGIPDREKEIYYQQQRKGLQTEDWKDEEVDITFARKACEYIENHTSDNPDNPFFLYVAPASPHRPCDVRPDFVIGKSQAGDRGDMVVLFDWIVGQVRETIDRLGLTDDTLFIVTSDNGARLTCYDGDDYGHKSNGDWRGQKADIWEGGHREPLVIRWPGNIEPGTHRDDFICLTDIMTTIADITGCQIPKAAAEDSRSFAHALAGAPPTKREPIVHQSVSGLFSIRDESWKLILGLGSGGFTQPRHEDPVPNGPAGQLYNLEKDPREQHNLWLEYPDKVEELTEIFLKFHKEGRSIHR